MATLGSAFSQSYCWKTGSSHSPCRLWGSARNRCRGGREVISITWDIKQHQEKKRENREGAENESQANISTIKCNLGFSSLDAWLSICQIKLNQLIFVLVCLHHAPPTSPKCPFPERPCQLLFHILPPPAATQRSGPNHESQPCFMGPRLPHLRAHGTLSYAKNHWDGSVPAAHCVHVQ
jgi:hypothetical protein